MMKTLSKGGGIARSFLWDKRIGETFYHFIIGIA